MNRIISAAVVVLIVGGMFANAQELPVFEPAVKTSYKQVTGYLNPGGDTFAYQTAAQWGATLDALVPAIRNLVLATAGRHDREGAEVAFHFIEAFLKDSGLRALNGVGASSIPIGDGLHHNRVYLGHAEGQGKGLLWDVFMQKNTPLPLLKALPADTVLATRIPLRGDLAWKWVRDTIGSLQNEQARREIQKELFEDALREGVDLNKWFGSLGEGAGIVLTLTPKPEGAAEAAGGPEAIMMDLVGRASLAILVEVKDDTIFDALEAIFLKGQAPMKRQDAGEVKALVMQGRLPVPGQGPLTIARFGKYLAFTSNDRILKALSEAKGGLTETAEFKRVARKLPQEGMGFSFLSERLGNEFAVAIKQIMAEQAAPQGGMRMAGMGSLLMTAVGQLKGQMSYAVSVRTTDGALAMNTATFGLAEAMVGKTLTGPLVGMAPIFGMRVSGARGQARATSDMSNLKQIGLGMMMFADDNKQRFPADLGAVFPYVGSYQVFITPGSGTIVAASAAQLRGGQCDYLYFGAGLATAGIKNPSRTPIACTKPGLLPNNRINVLYADGHVQGQVGIPPDVKALIAKARQKGAVVNKHDVNYARIRGMKLGLHIGQTMPKARILLLMPPTPKGGPAEALAVGLRVTLGKDATIVDTVTLAPPKDAKGDAWFTGALVNEQTTKYQGKVDLVVSGMGLPEQGLGALWFWKSGAKVALVVGDVSKLKKAIMAQLVIAAAAANPDVIPDDWQPPQDLAAAFAKRYLLVTPENVQQMSVDHPKLFR